MSYRSLVQALLSLSLAFCGLAALSPASASVVEALDLRGMVQEADRVLLGQVVSQASRYDERGRIVTDVQMQVEESLLGDEAPGSMVVVRHLGGVVDGIGMRVHGEPSFEMGEGVLLFGRRIPNRLLLRPVGMSQGAVRIFERAGVRWARSGAAQLTTVRRGVGGVLTKTAAPVSTPRELDGLLREVRNLIREKAR